MDNAHYKKSKSMIWNSIKKVFWYTILILVLIIAYVGARALIRGIIFVMRQ